VALPLVAVAAALHGRVRALAAEEQADAARALAARDGLTRRRCASVRAVDVAARYGGDEFAVILLGATLPEAVIISERVDAAIAAIAHDAEGTTIGVRASVGVVMLPAHARTRAEIIRAAVGTAYAAKEACKGRVWTATT